jgi:hypothetical protein
MTAEVRLTDDGYTVGGTLEDLRRLAIALLYAASDMAQAQAACDMLEEETENGHRARALEAAIAVCYSRAFTMSDLKRLDHDIFAPPVGTQHRVVHETLLTLRNKVYAHTDIESGRSIEQLTIDFHEDIATVSHVESWHPLDRSLLGPIRELCDLQAERLRLEGVRIIYAIHTAQASADG